MPDVNEQRKATYGSEHTPINIFLCFTILLPRVELVAIYLFDIIAKGLKTKAAERVYPVILDPSTSTTTTSSYGDTYVHSGDSAGNHNTSYYLRTGCFSDGGITRSLINIPMPSVGGVVFDAKLNLSSVSETTTTQAIDVY